MSRNVKKALAVTIGALALVAVTATTAPAQALVRGDASRANDPVPPGRWRITWQDDFDGNTLDRSKWTTYTSSYSDGCRGNLPWYKAEYNLPRNLSVNNGVLTITAKREAYTSPSGARYEWTSGLITTGSSCGHDPAAGARVHQGDYIQVRTKLPGEVGMWPAFWTWQTSDGSWSDEVDVFEYHPENRTILEMANHTPPDVGGNGYDAGYDLSGRWHYIGAFLGTDHVDWYLDGRKIYTDPNGFNSQGASLIVDLGVVDGTFHPKPPAEVSSARMYVDSVKVYHQC